jgi:hypothetical protein
MSRHLTVGLGRNAFNARRPGAVDCTRAIEPWRLESDCAAHSHRRGSTDEGPSIKRHRGLGDTYRGPPLPSGELQRRVRNQYQGRSSRVDSSIISGPATSQSTTPTTSGSERSDSNTTPTRIWSASSSTTVRSVALEAHDNPGPWATSAALVGGQAYLVSRNFGSCIHVRSLLYSTS